LNSEIISLRTNLYEGFRHDLEKIPNNFSKITTFLLSNSSPMSKTDKVGLSITLIALGMIFSPIAFSDSDPYHLKWLLNEIKGNLSLIDNLGENQEKHYRVIAHLKLSQENHLDATEKIILGKFRSLTN
jgi:hypothetical protein